MDLLLKVIGELLLLFCCLNFRGCVHSATHNPSSYLYNILLLSLHLLLITLTLLPPPYKDPGKRRATEMI